MLTRRPHNLGTVPIDAAPTVGAAYHHAGRAYVVDRIESIIVRTADTPYPRARVYGWPVAATDSPTLRGDAARLARWIGAKLDGRLGLALGLLGLLALFAIAGTLDAHAMTTAQYVAKRGPARAKLMAYHAHGHAKRCDFDRNGKYGRKQAECVVRVVFRHDGARALRNAFRVISCESGWNARNVSGPNTDGTYDLGLFQANTIHRQPRRKMLDAVSNAEFARRLWIANRRHWSPTWVCASRMGIR